MMQRVMATLLIRRIRFRVSGDIWLETTAQRWEWLQRKNVLRLERFLVWMPILVRWPVFDRPQRDGADCKASYGHGAEELTSAGRKANGQHNPLTRFSRSTVWARTSSASGAFGASLR